MYCDITIIIIILKFYISNLKYIIECKGAYEYINSKAQKIIELRNYNVESCKN